MVGRSLRLMAAVGVVVGLSACSTSTPPTGAASSPVSAPATGVTVSPGGVEVPAMPLDPYRISASDAATVGYAIAVLKQKCMARFGFTLSVRPLDNQRVADNDRVDRSRMYGITDAAVARVYGYGFPPDYQPPADSGVGQLSQAAMFVLTGNRDGDLNPAASPQATPGEVGGLAVPVGGCTGEAQRAIGDVPGANTTTLGDQLAAEAGYKSIADPDYLSLKAAWIECMRGRGYARESPSDRPASTNGQPASSAEVQEALADIDCKQETDYVAKFAAVHAKYESELLEQNQAALSQEQGRLQDIIKKAAAAVAAAHGAAQ